MSLNPSPNTSEASQLPAQIPGSSSSPSTRSPFLLVLANLVFEIKRHYYQLRYPNLKIEPGVSLKGHLKLQGQVRVTISSGCRLGKEVLIYGSGTVTIGHNVSLNGCWIGCESSVITRDQCLISDCAIADSDYHNLEPHLRHCPPGPKATAPIVLERNVWVGARATVMKGVCVGENSVIGLGSVIRQSVPSNVVVIGNPQQIVKHLSTSLP